MITRYGKEIDLNSIRRDVGNIRALIDECKDSAYKYDISLRPKRRKCIACGSTDRDLFATIYDNYDYYECNQCGALTLDSFPNPREMYSTENSENLGIYIDKRTFEERVNRIASPKVEFVLDVISKNSTTPKSWIDIGCGGGELLYYLKNRTNGIEGVGLETDKAELSFAKEIGLTVYDKYIDTDSVDDEITDLIKDKDVVSFINVLEHIEKPVEYIEYIYNSMKEGAYLVLEVPKHPSLASFANLTSNNNVYRHIIPPIHLQIFSKKSLELLMVDKFEIKATWEFGQGFMDMINNAMLQNNIDSNKTYELITNSQNSIQKAVDEAGLSDQILLIARKGEN